MTDEDFDEFYLEEQRMKKSDRKPNRTDMLAYVRRQVGGVTAVKLCRRFEVEGVSRRLTQIEIQILLDSGECQLGSNLQLIAV